MTPLWRDPRQKKKDVVELGLDPAIQTPEASWMPISSGHKSHRDGVCAKDKRIGIGGIGEGLCSGAQPNREPQNPRQ